MGHILGEILQKGCDERIYLNDDRFLKYGITFYNSQIVNRGSCTCSGITNDGITYIQTILDEYANGKTAEMFLRERTAEMHSLLDRENDNFEIFFGPSGTDLSFYPAMFQMLINPTRPILNVMLSADETGSGSGTAADGRYHGNLNQFKSKVSKGDLIDSNNQISIYSINVRDENGYVISPLDELKEVIKSNPDHTIIVNVAHSTKSGLEDNLDYIDYDFGDNVIWNIDLCQFRHSVDLIKSFISKGAMVMITGSKFYQSPPFCGAMLVPTSIYDQIKTKDWSQLAPYSSVFSKYDVPEELWSRVPFNPSFNISLQARWSCATKEMQSFQKLDQKKVKEKINLWHDTVIKYLEESEDFEIMPGQDMTNKTIIPFRVLANGRHLDIEELKEFHYKLVTRDYSDSQDFKNMFIGQAVPFGNKAFMRFAIGSKNIRHFIKHDVVDFPEDKILISLIQQQLKEDY